MKRCDPHRRTPLRASSRIAWTCWFALCATVAQAQQDASVQTAKPWLGRVQPPTDPLDPWPLEDVPRVGEAATAPQPAPAESLAAGMPFEPMAPVYVDSTDVVVVVRCRQILIEDPQVVPELERLLRDGQSLEVATKKLGIQKVEESRREYALDELEAGIRAQIAALPDSGWSSPREWRGRTALFQVLERAERGRYTVPPLGMNLDDKDKSKLAKLGGRPVGQPQAQAADADFKPAAVLDQVQAVYPPEATESGEVKIVVSVGRIGEILDARVEQATAQIFAAPALAAARSSRYSPAERAGFAEPGEVRLIYKFEAPQSAPSSP